MSARSPVPTGWPPLAITNRAAAPAPTSRATNTLLLFGEAALPSSHTTHGTLSFAPVRAISGSIPSRVGSTFIEGSVVAAGIDPAPEATRSTPTCWKHNPPFAPVPAGGLIGFAPSFGQVVPDIGLT